MIKTITSYVVIGVAVALLALTAYFAGKISQTEDNAAASMATNTAVLVQSLTGKASVNDVKLLCFLSPSCIAYVQNLNKK